MCEKRVPKESNIENATSTRDGSGDKVLFAEKKISSMFLNISNDPDPHWVTPNSVWIRGVWDILNATPCLATFFLALVMIHIAWHILIYEINFFFAKINYQNHWDITPWSHSAQYKCASFYRNKKVMALGQEKIGCYKDEYQSGFFGWRALEWRCHGVILAMCSSWYLRGAAHTSR